MKLQGIVGLVGWLRQSYCHIWSLQCIGVNAVKLIYFLLIILSIIELQLKSYSLKCIFFNGMEMEIITKIQSLNIKSEINSSFNFFQQLDGFIKNF